MSEETKNKISKTKIKNGDNIGEKNPMFGKHHSIETRNKQSILKKGKLKSEEHKQKMREAQRIRREREKQIL
jgi:hypothetical protein